MKRQAKIYRVWFENFKAYKEKTILPLSSITLLLGYNGSGKTSAILGLQLLSLLALGKSITRESLQRNTKKPDFGLATEYLSYYDQDTFQIGCSLDTKSKWKNLNIIFSVSKNGLEIIEETISNDSGEYLYQAKKKENKNFKAYFFLQNFDEVNVDNQRSIFSQFAKPKKGTFKDVGMQHELSLVTKDFQNALSEIHFLYANLLDWNLSSFTKYKTLREDGSNLSSVLYYLCEELSMKEKILNFIRENSSDRTIDLSFEKTENGKIRIEQYTIPYFSEGQLRLLATAAALFSAKEGSLVVLDDIDSSLDVIRAQKIIKDIYRISEIRNLQILFTSHNPALLDSLPIQAISDVVFSFRKPGESSSSLMKIDELETYPELISKGPLGKLMTTGALRRYVEERKTKEQKKADSLQWLDEFEKGTKSE
jgi:AAA15 family ATPase/GTPase